MADPRAETHQRKTDGNRAVPVAPVANSPFAFITTSCKAACPLAGATEEARHPSRAIVIVFQMDVIVLFLPRGLKDMASAVQGSAKLAGCSY